MTTYNVFLPHPFNTKLQLKVTLEADNFSTHNGDLYLRKDNMFTAAFPVGEWIYIVEKTENLTIEQEKI